MQRRRSTLSLRSLAISMDCMPDAWTACPMNVANIPSMPNSTGTIRNQPKRGFLHHSSQDSGGSCGGPYPKVYRPIQSVCAPAAWQKKIGAAIHPPCCSSLARSSPGTLGRGRYIGVGTRKARSVVCQESAERAANEGAGGHLGLAFSGQHFG